MELPQSFSLIDVLLSSLVRQELPPAAQLFGDLGVVFVGSDFGDFPTLKLRPDHESVHRSFDVVQLVFFGLQKEEREKIETK